MGERDWRLNLLILFLGMYLFVFSLSGLKNAWTHIFAADGKTQVARRYINQMTSNPLSGVCLGIIATALVQSSSGVVAVAITTVAAGGLTTAAAVPLIMGANIGTTVTCVLVTLGYAIRRVDFEKALPVALAHDIFNILNVGLFFLIEYHTRLLSETAQKIANIIGGLPVLGYFLTDFPDLLDFITDPLQKPLEELIFSMLVNPSTAALVYGFLSFAVLILGLELMGGAAEATLKGKAAEHVHKAFKTKFRGVFFGAFFSSILQSSSVATSLAIPFAASGKIKLKEVYPYLLGCNIGTTIDPGQIASYIKFGVPGLSIGLVHIILNLSGVFIWLSVKGLAALPLRISEKLAHEIASSKHPSLSLIAYTLLMFFILPATILVIL